MAEGAVETWAEETQPFYFWRRKMIEYITTDGYRFVVHIGQTEEIKQMRSVAYKVGYLQANRDELDFILGQMSVPTVTGLSVISWYGDDAKFIAGNFIYGE